jgi:arylsulfate sulfotransferase
MNRILFYPSLFRYVLVFLIGAYTHVFALNFSIPPSFVKSAQAPLAGTLSVKTDVPSRVSVTVNDGFGSWTRNFYDYSTSHSVPLYGFKPARNNNISITVHDRDGNELTAPNPVLFSTGALPSNFPVFNVLVRKADRMEPGYNLIRAVVNPQLGYIIIVNNSGEVVWYTSLTSGLENRQLPNGNLLQVLPNAFNEFNLLGVKVKTWAVSTNLNIDTHDVFFTSNNTILYIHADTTSIANFPSSATDPNAPRQTAKVQYDRIIEMSAIDGSVSGNWSVLDLLDPLRITYLSFAPSALGLDIHHGNAVIEDPRDGSIILSVRDQNAVVKFSRDGNVKWILGPHENWGPEYQQYLLTPVGTPFQWNYGQHAPRITREGTLLLYDNGNFRASPFDESIPDSENFSRAVEFDINEETMEVRQIWEYGTDIPEQLYTGSVGNVEQLPKTGNILIDFGNISYVSHARPSAYSTNASMARIKEVTHDANKEVLFDLAVFDYKDTSTTYRGNWVYRCYRIPDLYGHPALPVQDLRVATSNGVPYLQFSGDPTFSYSVEVSNDLESWTDIGTGEPTADDQFIFQDVYKPEIEHRYYRIVTQQE